MNFPSIIFVFKHKNQIILNFSSNNGIYEKDISSKIDQISNFLISDPIYNIFWSKIRQCVPLRVTVVPLKPRNFRKNGRPEIPEILVNFRSVNRNQTVSVRSGTIGTVNGTAFY